jgi:hypothetical protein
MDRINRKVVEDKDNLHRLIELEWMDAYDESAEIDIKDMNIVGAKYVTSGYLMGTRDKHVIIGYNKEVPFKGVYKGHGVIPESLITNVNIMDRNCK